MQLLIDSIVFLLSFTICFVIWKLVRQNGKRGGFALAVAGALFGLHLAASSYPALWLKLAPFPAVVVLSAALGWMAAPIVVHGLALRINRRSDRQSLLVLSALVGLYAAWMVGCSLTPAPPGGEEVRLDGVLLQNSDYTCVAASAVNYLDLMGFHITEDEAVLKGLIGIHGGDDLNAWRILRLTLPEGYSVRAGKISKERMLRESRWYMVPLRMEMNVGHEVLVRPEPGGKTLMVLDPVSGEDRMLWHEFESMWLGTAVWAEPPATGLYRMTASAKR